MLLVAHEGLNFIDKVERVGTNLDIGGGELLGNRANVGALIQGGIVGTGREGKLAVMVSLRSNQADDGGRIQSAGEARAHSEAGGEAKLHAIVQEMQEMFRVGGFIGIANRCVGINVPVLPRFQGIVSGRIKKRVRRLQCGDIAKESFRGSVCLCVGEITVNGAEVGFRRNQAGSEKRFHLRGKKKSAATAEVVERLFAEAVASGEELLVFRVPNGESEHAIQEREAFGSPSSISSEEHFGIGVRTEWVGFEFVAQPRLPSITPSAGEFQRPASSGPRCSKLSRMRSAAGSPSGQSFRTQPTIPDMNWPSARRTV